MAGLLTDIRFSFRALMRAPGFVVLCAVCLGIGIGASVMTFTVLDRALLQPLGSVDPEGLVAIGEVRTSVPDQWWQVSIQNFNDWQTAIDDTAELSAFRGSGFDVSSNDEEIRVEGAQITRNLFSVFGISPILGPGLSQSEDAVSEQSVVLLSETFWRRRLDGDRAIIGQVVTIDGSPHVVVGIMPALLDVGMPTALRAAQAFVPLQGDPALPRDDRSFSVVGRLAPEVDVEHFTSRLESIVTALAARYPENDGWSVRVDSMGAGSLTSAEPTLLISMIAAALVLLIGCANVANLTLASSIRRRHEFGIRATVGASGLRIARQQFVESLVVASLGAVLGLAMASIGLDVIAVAYSTDSLAPAALPIDASTFAFVICLTLITTLAFGLYPAVETARGAIRAQIAESGAGTTIAKSRKNLRQGLVIGQVAASMVLLIGAALLAQSFMNILALERGVETSTVTSIRVETLDDTWNTNDVARNVQAVLDAFESIPSVETAATGGWVLPLRGGGLRSRVSTPTMSEPDTGTAVAYTGISADFFHTLGIPIFLGQTLDRNVRRPDLAVINSAMAELLWPGQNPVGQQFRLESESDRGWVTVAGVSGNFLTWDSSRDDTLPMAFFDARTFDSYPTFYFIKMRSADFVVTAQEIHRAVDALGIPLQRTIVTPMEQVARDPFWRQRLFSLWFVAFGAAALTLTAIGIYGVLAYLVRQRLPEIGIRMALGAGRYRMLLMVLHQGTAFAGLGIVVGLGGAWLLARSMRGLLFGVEPLDPAMFLFVTAGLACVAVTASVLPAVRASRVEPMKALRSD